MPPLVVPPVVVPPVVVPGVVPPVVVPPVVVPGWPTEAEGLDGAPPMPGAVNGKPLPPDESAGRELDVAVAGESSGPPDPANVGSGAITPGGAAAAGPKAGRDDRGDAKYEGDASTR